MKITTRKILLSFLITTLFLIAIFFIAINSGGIKISFSELINGLFFEYNQNVSIILELRFPRIIVAILGGALMAMSGVCMQAVMRNPLADPGIIGITSGAALAAVIVSAFFPSLAAFTPIFSFFGGMIAFFIVYTLAWNKEISHIRLILTGIAVDACFTGLYEAFNSFTGASYSGAARIINANISLKTWGDVYVLLIYVIIAVILCALIVNKCNLLSLSDKTVIGLGIDVTKTRIIVSIISVLMASVFTAMIGAVSFLGLIVPHIARLLVGSDHKKLLPYSALLGSTVFLAADTIGRTIAYPYEISSAIIMAIIGGPMLVILLKRSGIVYGK